MGPAPSAPERDQRMTAMEQAIAQVNMPSEEARIEATEVVQQAHAEPIQVANSATVTTQTSEVL